MPNYTKIPDSFRQEYKKKFTGINPDDIARLSEQDPIIFAYYLLGKKVRLHQAYILDQIIKSKKRNDEIGQRIAVCWARQLGKSISLGIFVIWACWYNKYPVTISDITVIYVCSKEDESAMELIEKIRLILYDGDRYMLKMSDDEHFFTGSLKEPNNTHQITFLTNCFIKSIPPTMKAVGKSASWFILDEAHRLRCVDMTPDTFFSLASIMVSETGGGILLSSTSQGITGFFYHAIDPENQNPDNEYEHFWFKHDIWDDDSKACSRYKAYVVSEKVRMTREGKFKLWQQEFESLFTVTQESFFEHTDIDDAIKDTSQEYEHRDTPCSAGYDYGMNTSRTVITIRTKIAGELIELFQFRGEAGFDNNLLHDPSWEHSIQKLKRRYDLSLGVYVDDCPNGNDNNKWMQKHSGLQIYLYNFRSDQMSMKDGVNRNCAAYSYRSKLKEGILKIPKWNKTQQFEMKIIQETVQKVLISIKSPDGQLCDTFDSDMMACIPFLDMKDIRDFKFDNDSDDDIMSQDDKFRSAYYDSFHSLTDEECRKMIEEANEERLI